jgi:sporulation protein YlmC with PRC-barrel domain
MRTILGVVLASALVVPAVAGTSEVKDVDVYNQQSQKLGEVTEVVTNPNGNVEQVVVEVTGGEEDRAVAVPLDQMKMRGNKIVLAMSRDQLMAMPPYRQ